MKSLNYTFSEYVFARVSAMKNLLLRRRDYEKMLNMGPSEIIKYLQEGVYKQEINEFATRESGVSLMEKALKLHMENISQKLLSMSPADIRQLLYVYLGRYDYWNIKVLLRSMINKEELDKELFVLGGSFDIDQLEGFATYEDPKKLLLDTGLINKQYIEKLDDADLFDMENMLDASYLQNAIDSARSLPEEARLFKEFFQYEVDVHNIMLILKKITLQLPLDVFEPYFLRRGRVLSTHKIEQIKHLRSIDDLANELRGTRMDHIFQQKKSIQEYERELQKFLMEKGKTLSNSHPLTVDVIIGYLFAKEVEVQNLRMIFKSKVLGGDPEKIKAMVIM